jgi:hypothetical protein
MQGFPVQLDAEAALGAITINMIGAAIAALPSIRRRERLTLGKSKAFSNNPASAKRLIAAMTTSGHMSVICEMTPTVRAPSQSAQMRLADVFNADAWCVAST